MIRSEGRQAVSSAGDGGDSALNSPSDERGERVRDFETPDDVPELG